MHPSHLDLAGVQFPGVTHHHLASLRVQGNHIKGRRIVDPQASSLADREVGHPLMASSHGSARVSDDPRPDRLSHTLLQIFPIVSRDEADLLALLFLRDRKPQLARDPAGILLAQVSDRKERGRKLLLRQLVEKVALVFESIGAPTEPIPSGGRVAIHAGVMAGGYPRSPPACRAQAE